VPEVRESVDGECLVRESLLMRVMRVACLLLALGTAACGPSEPLNVVAIQTGKSLNTDHSVANHATSFRPKDTMYVSVLSNGRGAGTITVKWSFAGRVVHEATKKVSYNDQAATDFRFQAADDFPIGDYAIEVVVDGKTIETRRVKVE
jgi:hypothetical protein